MRAEAGKSGDVERMQAWAGQSAALASSAPAGELVRKFWEEAEAMLE
jgi:nitronate monooxygenase